MVNKKEGTYFTVHSGCTQHITNIVGNFTTMNEVEPIRVHLSDNRVEEPNQRGTVTIDHSAYKHGTKGVTRLLLIKVLYIPDSIVNFISCTQLYNCGISTLI